MSRRPFLLALWFIGLVSIPMSMVPAQVFNYLTGVLQSQAFPAFTAILPIILLYFLCRSGIAFLDVVRTMVNGVYLEQSVRDYTLKVFSRVLRISPDFFRRHDPARIANRVINDTRTVESFWLSLYVSVPSSLLGLFAYAYVLFFGLSRDTPLVGIFLGQHTQMGSWFLGSLILVLAPIQSYFVFFDRKIQEINREAARAGDEIVTRAHETMAGVSEIRANNAFDYAMDRVAGTFAGYRDVQIRMTKLSAFFTGAGPMINALVNCILLAIGARLCLGPLEVPGLSAAIAPIRWQDYLGFTFMAMTVHGYIGALMRFYLRWRMVRETIRRVDEYVKSPLVFFPDDSAPDLHPAVDPLSFSGVDFETALGSRILGDLNIKVAPGERLAFAGPSGSGKTTAMSLVTRDLEPTRGSLSFGDKPVSGINFDSLSREVALVPQKPMLFDMSIRDNILFSLRRPCENGFRDGGWEVDAARLPGVGDTSGLDRVLLSVVEKVGLSEDLAKKALDNPCPENRLECSSIIARARELCAAISAELSKNPDMVVFFDPGRYLAEGTLEENLLYGRPRKPAAAVGERVPPEVRRIHELLSGSPLLDGLLDLGRWRFMRDAGAGLLVQRLSPRLFGLLAAATRAGLDAAHMTDQLHAGEWREMKASLKDPQKLVLLEVALETSARTAASFFLSVPDFEDQVVAARGLVTADPEMRAIGIAPLSPEGAGQGTLLRDALAGGRANSLFRGSNEYVDQAVTRVLAERGLLDELTLLGLETFAGVGGRKLSGGQMMKVCLARALIKEPGVILLDEVTAPLDEKSQARVLDTLASLPPDRTVILVSHRMNAIRACGRVIVFDRGRVVQDGSFEELCRAPGLFRTLAGTGEAQAQAQAPAPSRPGPPMAGPVEEGAAGLSAQAADLMRAIALSPTFSGLNAGQISLLERVARRVSAPGGSLLFSRGDPGSELFIILEGEVEFSLEREKDGKAEKDVINTFGPGQAFGELALFGEMPRTLTARAVTDVKLCTIDREDLLEVIQASPDVGVRLLKTVSLRLAYLMDRDR